MEVRHISLVLGGYWFHLLAVLLFSPINGFLQRIILPKIIHANLCDWTTERLVDISRYFSILTVSVRLSCLYLLWLFDTMCFDKTVISAKVKKTYSCHGFQVPLHFLAVFSTGDNWQMVRLSTVPWEQWNPCSLQLKCWSKLYVFTLYALLWIT